MSKRLTKLAAVAIALLAITGCGSGRRRGGPSPPPRSAVATATTATATTATATTATATTATTTTGPLPGTGRPPVAIGDKNTFPEQFVLGELYAQALAAEGFTVTLDRNIGPIGVTMDALRSGSLGMYPEYIDVWDQSVAGYARPFASARAAYLAGQRYALAHGLALLDPTPFSDTDGLAVLLTYAVAHGLSTIGDLRRLAPYLTIGGPPQFEDSPTGLAGVELAYGFAPAAFKSVPVGEQYSALEKGTIQVADVATSDGQLSTDRYALLRDPAHVFGFGNVVPVVTAKVLEQEGPTFAATINDVSALLTLPVMRQLNADVALYHQDPATVARRFLEAHHLAAPKSS